MTVVPITGGVDIAAALRELADHIEEMPDRPTSVTLVVGRNLYCFGPVGEDRLAECTAFDLMLGQALLMSVPVAMALSEADT